MVGLNETSCVSHDMIKRKKEIKEERDETNQVNQRADQGLIRSSQVSFRHIIHERESLERIEGKGECEKTREMGEGNEQKEASCVSKYLSHED